MGADFVAESPSVMFDDLFVSIEKDGIVFAVGSKDATSDGFVSSNRVQELIDLLSTAPRS